MRGQKFEFTFEQEKYIVDNWGKVSAHSMKKMFGCSWYAVVSIAKNITWIHRSLIDGQKKKMNY